MLRRRPISFPPPPACLRAPSAPGRRGRAGQAIAEFAIVFPLQLLLFFGLAQLILLTISALLVNFAAFRACRAAIVTPVVEGQSKPEDAARIAAQVVLSPLAGSHLGDRQDLAAVEVPGWGELHGSLLAGGKIRVKELSEPDEPECRLAVEFDQELVFPVVDAIFAAFFRLRTGGAADEGVFAKIDTGFAETAETRREMLYGTDKPRMRKIGGAWHLAIARECTLARPVLKP